MEFDFYDLCWYWDNKTDNTEGKIDWCIQVSHLVVSALCYWVWTEIGKIIARTTAQHVTQDEAVNPEIQKSIRNYHMTLKSTIVADKFMLDINGMDEFINKDVMSQEEEYV